MLAQEVLTCTAGPCIALETEGEKKVCGLIRRPAWYMFGEDRPASETGQLSVMFANALGVGRGCDADDVSRDVWHPVIRMGNTSLGVNETFGLALQNFNCCLRSGSI